MAPEHVSDAVLSVMGKPGNAVYERFRDRLRRVNADLGRNSTLVPYLMSFSSGSTLKSGRASGILPRFGIHAGAGAGFHPTPSTMSTCMYYTE